MKKILAIVLMLSLMTVLACTALASGEAPAAAAAQTPLYVLEVVKPATATEKGLSQYVDSSTGAVLFQFETAPTGGAAAEGVTWADYQAYLIETAGANAPDLAEFEGQVKALTGWDDIDQTVSPWDQMFTTLGLSTWEEFQQGIVKEMAVAGSNEPASAEPAAEQPASAEPAQDGSAEPAAEQSASAEPAAEQPASAEPAAEQPASAEPAAEQPATEEAPAEEESAVANPDYDPAAHNWASIELVLAIVIIVVGAILMLSFGKKKEI